ncbi:hypothetical protein [Nocardia otitidiscaviarum]|uniref:hypothetical protein n=1 Tax=Nocardia otitidiscaviarum TaxID=1823 RepID=UPI00189635DC|nr:hypothetical protein [Nocardia otitidiscaviarum]
MVLVGMMPVFGPPIALVVVALELNWGLDPVAAVIGGAVAAGTGRFLLATATNRLRGHLNPRRQASLRAVDDYLSGSKGRFRSELALFLLAPLPSAQMFEAAGLMGMRLVPITVAFVFGRLVSLSFYVGAATVAERSLGAVFVDAATSVYGVTIQIVLLAVIVVLARVDWIKKLPAVPDSRDGNG